LVASGDYPTCLLAGKSPEPRALAAVLYYLSQKTYVRENDLLDIYVAFI
jgi:hypothetical protein